MDERTAAILRGLADGCVPRNIPADVEYAHELTQLRANMVEFQRFTLAISEGDLSQPLRGLVGPIAGSLKTLQASLKHLSWQATQITAGDFSQRVDFMGEFSAAFNNMAQELEKSRKGLQSMNDQLQKDNMMLQRMSTELTETRDQLERTNKLLDARVQDRTSKLQAVNEQLQEELRRREQTEHALSRLSCVIEQSPASIVITDPDGNIEYANPKCARITGYESSEVCGQNPRIFKSGETPPEVYKELWETISSGLTWHGEFHNKKKNGEPFWESATISPIYSKEGVISSYVAIKDDVTEQKKLENELRQAQKMEAVGQLAGGIAHDFNNILTAIIGNGSIAAMKLTKDNPVRHRIEKMLSSADKAAKLTASLLAFSRKQITNPKPLNLNDVVRNMEDFLQRVIVESIRIETIFKKAELNVSADVGQLEQVLVNLATNARDAMPDGGVLTITTEAVKIDEHFIRAHGCGAIGKYAMLSVTDTGIGMEKETTLKIFEPFFTTKEVGKGSGLGLSMAFGIVKQHDGFITVESAPGEGSTLSLYLPLHESKEKHEEETIDPPVSGGTETILIAEDDEDVREVTAMFLKDLGYALIEATDGEDAVNQFMEHQDTIKLVLLDMIMPRKNGREAFDAIRKLCPETPALFMSGYASDILQAEDLGADGPAFLMKPTRPQELAKKVRELLDGCRVPSSRARTVSR